MHFILKVIWTFFSFVKAVTFKELLINYAFTAWNFSVPLHDILYSSLICMHVNLVEIWKLSSLLYFSEFALTEIVLVHNTIAIGILHSFLVIRAFDSYWWIIVQQLFQAILLQKIRSQYTNDQWRIIKLKRNLTFACIKILLQRNISCIFCLW